jgi:hypothetical protein
MPFVVGQQLAGRKLKGFPRLLRLDLSLPSAANLCLGDFDGQIGSLLFEAVGHLFNVPIFNRTCTLENVLH